MLVKSLRASPSILLFLVFCALFGWQLSRGTESNVEVIPGPAPPPPPPAPEPQKEEPPQPQEPAPAPPPPPSPPKEPAKPKEPPVAVVTFVTDQRSYLHLSLKNKDHYARRHNYDFIVDYESHTDNAHGTTWWKYNMMERLIKAEKWDWLWWVDFDTLITNTDIKVMDVIGETLRNVTNPDEIDILTTHDCNGLNTGSFVVRSHPRSIKFLHSIYETEKKEKDENPDRQMSEQDAMAQLIESDKAAGDRTVRVPQWKLNAFPAEIECYDEPGQVWKPGMFILHFAGAWAHVKGEDPTGQLMNKYEDKIIWGPWEEFY